MGVEYGENPAPTERQKASISREFLPNGGLASFFSALLGGIPRKKWTKQEVTPGVECGETPLFQWVECGERLRMQRRGLCPLSRYSISFLK
jgi:hypothetical protein